MTKTLHQMDLALAESYSQHLVTKYAFISYKLNDVDLNNLFEKQEKDDF